MKLSQSKTKTDVNQKDTLKALFFDSPVDKNIEKPHINTDQFKSEPERPELLLEKKTPVFSTLKQPISDVVKNTNVYNTTNIYPTENNTTNSSSFDPTYNTTNSSSFDPTYNTTKSSFLDPEYNTTKNSALDNTVNNQISSGSIINNTSNATANSIAGDYTDNDVDLKSSFIPSNETQNKINQTFFDISKSNVTNMVKPEDAIPALQAGGVVKKPTVSYLHQNEAVVPLANSPEFSKVVDVIKQSTTNNISKNEINANVSSIKNNSTTSYNNNKQIIENIAKNKQPKKEKTPSQPPIIINQGSVGGAKVTDDGKSDLGRSYVGSSSKHDFYAKVNRLPDWRTRIG
jgi:hypothetical protein